MADRRVKVILEAQVDRYKSAMSAAARSTEELEKAIKETDSTTAKRTKALRDLSPLLMGIGTATVAGLGASTKAAMDWESAWAGVMKTVEGTPQQMQAVEDGLRGLARELPASHTEIAAVAEAAGQLGIATPDVVDFTRTMINMGESTNLTAEEAATTLARFSNVMGTSTADMGRLGATIVGLGNNFATTESEIANMAQRLSGAGAQIGLAESDVLGIATAMSSVGIEAEAGGSAMSLTMKRIENAVADGGDEVETFAKTAGMTSEEFSRAWRDDAAGALTTFVTGLGEAGAQGENVNGILSELGITGIRESDALLRLASAGELMGDAIAQGGEEFEKGSALVEEAQKRYETAESRIRIAWNTIKDAAIEAGGAILPVVADLADGVADLVGWFADLPTPVQNTLTALGGIAGVGAGALGLFVNLAPKVRDTRDALRDLAPAGSRASRALGGVGKAVAAIAVVQTLGPMLNNLIPDATIADADKFADAIRGVGDSSSGLESLNTVFKDTRGFMENTGIDGFEESLQFLADPNFSQTAGKTIAGIFGMDPGGLVLARENMEKLDATLAGMAASGDAEAAASGYEKIAAQAEAMGIPTEKLVDLFPQYTGQLQAIEDSNAADAQAELDGALEEVGLSADGVIESMNEYLEKLFQAGLLTMTSRDAAAAYQASLDGVDDVIKQITESNGEMGSTLNKSKTDFDLTSEAGRLANETFQGLARGGMDEVKALAEEGVGQDVLQQKLGQTYADLIETGQAFGLTGEDAEELARKILGVPDGVSIDSWMDDEAKRTAEATKAAADAIDGRVVTITTTAVRNEITRRWTENPQSGGTSLERRAYGQGRFASGGRAIRRYSDGGRLPDTGLGTDQILGIGYDGHPTAWVDDREWIINRKSSDLYHRELAMINAGTFPKLPGFAGGGIPAGGGVQGGLPQAAPSVDFPDTIKLQLGPGGPAVLAKVVRQGEHQLKRQ